MREHDIIGFDRKIELDWLDAVAARVADGAGDKEIRDYLWKLLDGEVAGDSFNSARGKTVTVLRHIWSKVPETVLPLRERALALLPRVEPQERLAVHWTMTVATYPFFADLVTLAGRGLALQGDFSLFWLKRRLIETWGERGTLRRAVERIVRSLVSWGVLRDDAMRGVLVAGDRLPIADPALGELLIESLLLASESRELPFGRLHAHPALSPSPSRSRPTSSAARRASRSTARPSTTTSSLSRADPAPGTGGEFGGRAVAAAREPPATRPRRLIQAMSP